MALNRLRETVCIRRLYPAVRGVLGGRDGSPFHCLRLSPMTDMAVIAAWLRLA